MWINNIACLNGGNRVNIIWLSDIGVVELNKYLKTLF